MTIDPICTHTLYDVLSTKTKDLIKLYLCLDPSFVFLFLLLQNYGALDHLFWIITIHHDHHLASPLGLDYLV
jgi:hypothetical protein